MADNQTVITKALGLATEPNQMEVPEGAMSKASNVVIRRNGVVESRRGMKLYADLFGSNPSVRAKQLLIYKERLLRHFEDTFQVENDDDTFTTIPGSFTEPDPMHKIRGIEANNNFYFTSSSGIQKISALNSSDLGANTKITSAGGIKAIDFNARGNVTIGDQSSILPQDTVVAYRVVWGLKDNNSNLILGSPSGSTTVSNPMTSLMVKDIVRLCNELDTFSSSLINSGTFTQDIGNQLNSVSTGLDIKNAIGINTLNLCQKLDENIYLGGTGATIGSISSAVISSGVCTITFSAPDATQYLQIGSKIYLNGFKKGGSLTDKVNGIQAITEVTTTTVKFLTAETGALDALGGTETIHSGEFRYIFNNADTQDTTYNVSLSESVITEPSTKPQNEIIQNTLQRIIDKLKNYYGTATVSNSDKNLISDILTTTMGVYIDISIPEGVINAFNDGILYFYQIYRTKIDIGNPGSLSLEEFISLGAPGDEMYLIDEAYPTSTDILNKKLTVEDLTPDNLLGATLYTNEQSGEGINNANEIPPFAKDISKFKNVTFYSNTRTKHRKSLNLISTDGLIQDFNATREPKLCIVNSDGDKTEYTFNLGSKESNVLNFSNGGGTNDLNVVGTSTYFVIYPANSFGPLTSTNPYLDSNDPIKYVVSYKHTGTTTPVIAEDFDNQIVVNIEIPFGGTETNVQIAQKTMNYLAPYSEDFTCSVDGLGNITIDNTDYGISEDLTIVGSGVTLTSTVQGDGEQATLSKIILYPSIESKALSVDETARSIVRIINKNLSENIYGYYVSNANTIPGQFLLESKTLSDVQFYVSVTTNSTTNNSGNDFNPTLVPEANITAISAVNDTITIQKIVGNGLVDADFAIGNKIVVFNSDQGTGLDGVRTILSISGTLSGGLTLKLDTNITTAVVQGSILRSTEVEASDNEKKSHRVYYSKPNQPEAVPILNYFDIGSSDQEIKRSFPLRDSLFMFKDDGLYRVSGETAPFSQALFDGTTFLLAPNSLDTVDNMLFGWTDQGIQVVTETGVEQISKSIYTDLLKLASSDYTNFKTITWGLGYHSDNSYLVFTNTDPSDVVPTIAYRYSTTTESWTTYDLTATCGLINPSDDKLYLGSGDINSLSVERKSLSRIDFADREYEFEIQTNQYSSGKIKISNLDNFSVGDVVEQEQFLTIYQYNNLLLKLDNDPLVTQNNFVSTLQAVSGNSMRLKLEQLATKLDTDASIIANDFASSIAFKSGNITNITATNPTVLTCVNHGLETGRYVNIIGSTSTPTINGSFEITKIDANTFSIDVNVLNIGSLASVSFTTDNNLPQDIQGCYNIIVSKLNVDNGVGYNNYPLISGTVAIESIITKVDKPKNEITLDKDLEFTVGPFTLYKAIPCSFQYTPLTMGDPLNYKHLREVTMMFANKAFTNASLSFNSDLFPELVEVKFNGDGNGIFGHQKFGLNFFGGTSNGAPFRTYVPRQCQRCRYIQVQFNHSVAREIYAVYGLTITGRTGLSSRAYRR